MSDDNFSFFDILHASVQPGIGTSSFGLAERHTELKPLASSPCDQSTQDAHKTRAGDDALGIVFVCDIFWRDSG
jgi:hypothetical protein